MTSLVGWIVGPLLELLAPATCSACGEPGPEPVFCTPCGDPLPVATGELDGIPLIAAGSYTPPLSDAIRRFKFEGHPELAGPLSTLLVATVRARGLGADEVWVPVPLHRARLIERGYDQAALLARALSKDVGAAVAPRLLERRLETAQQARLGRADRSENALGAFAVRRAWPGRGVVLVDDVVTTGATARACLIALHEAKIEVRAVVALARVLGSGQSSG